MVKRFLSLLAIALGLSTSSWALPVGHVGMWVWSDSAFSTDEARQRLVQFCDEYQIRHLDVHVRMIQAGTGPVLSAAEPFRELILLAGQHNITTAALRGNPNMFFLQNHERALRELRAVVEFSKTLPPINGFKGIKYDVEPYRTTEWKAGEAGPKTIMSAYLTFLLKARSVLREEAPRLWLAADIPFWWDKESYVLEFGGKSKRFSEHVQDLTDSVTVMSYRRNLEQILSCVENERRYAREQNKRIFTSLETIKLKQNQQISFWGVPFGEFWKMVPQLLETAKEDPSVAGVMLHCYRGLVENINNSNNLEDVAALPLQEHP